METQSVLLALVALAIVIAACYIFSAYRHPKPPAGAEGLTMPVCAAAPTPAPAPPLAAVDADPLVTGRLYSGPRAFGPGKRPVYADPGPDWVRWRVAGAPRAVKGDNEDILGEGLPVAWGLPSIVTDAPPHVQLPGERYDVASQGPVIGAAHVMPFQPDHYELVN